MFETKIVQKIVWNIIVFLHKKKLQMTIKGNLITDTSGLELIFNVTKDINEKTEKENKEDRKNEQSRRMANDLFVI